MRNLKRVLSLALALVMVLGMMVITTSAADFTDADEITYEEAVDVMAGLGLFKGDNGALKPQEVLTREEAATLMARIMLGEKTADKLVATKQIFADVPANDWAAKYIEYCYNTGLIGGYTVNGELVFNPDGKLTGVAFAKLLLCAMGYDANAQGYGGSNWASAIAVDALTAGLTIEGVVISADLTREGAAQMILQALTGKMVDYTIAYDYATGAQVKIGPNVVTETVGTGRTAKEVPVLFMDTYFKGLDKTEDGNGEWGRPYEYKWTNTVGKKTTTLYTAWETPLAVYTEAAKNCDIYDETGLKKGTKLDVYYNNDEVTGSYTIADNTKAYGAQGQLVEVYEDEVVIIDTYLAKVTDVTEVEYDRNGHIDEEAALELKVYNDVKGTTMTEYAETDYDYEVGDMLLVYVNETEDEEYFEIVAFADSIVGAQTKITTKDSHVVEDEEYLDAEQLWLDDAGRSTADFTWYFDQYGNLIGIEDIDAVYSYGVLTSIYWKDSSDGEDGYAIGKITYMDGSTETTTIYAAEGIGSETVKKVDDVIVYGDIEDTKSANKGECNTALYQIEASKNGLILTEATELDVDDATIATRVSTIVKGEAYADKTTMYLIWTGKAYETYTGIKNVPTYDSFEGIWAADITEDDEAEYIFVIKPDVDPAENQILYFNADVSDVETDLKNEIYTVFGGYIDNSDEDAAIEIEFGKEDDFEDNEVYEELAEYEGYLVVLTLEDGYVVDVDPVTDKPISLDKEKTWNAYVGTVGVGATVNSRETLMYVGDDSYDIEDATLIGAKNWDKAEGKYAYVVYTVNKYGYKTADYIYVTNVRGEYEAATTGYGTLNGVLGFANNNKGLWIDIGNYMFNEDMVVVLYDAKGKEIGSLEAVANTDASLTVGEAHSVTGGTWYMAADRTLTCWTQTGSADADTAPITASLFIDGTEVDTVNVQYRLANEHVYDFDAELWADYMNGTVDGTIYK